MSDAHIKPLVDFAARIRAEIGPAYGIPACHVPDFDPSDGGILAKALFLMEAPGPQAVKSGFVSRNNPDLTARNMTELLRDAGISRSQTALWNIVPWYVGTEERIRPVTRCDLRRAETYLAALLPLFPELRVVVLVGRKAEAGWKASRLSPSMPVVATYHPSPLVFHTSPDKKRMVQDAFVQVAMRVRDETERA